MQPSRCRAVVFLGVLGWAVATLGQANAQEPSLNQQMLDFANSKLGQQVGDGQCWTLAAAALDAVNAKRPGQDGFDVYQFGTVVDLGAVVPGDVLQFEDTNFQHNDPDGSWYSSSYPHHTAIVSAVSGTQITMLNQNIDGNLTVQVFLL